MTLEEFHSYTERQADWRTTPAMTADAAKADALRALLEFAEGGLSTPRGAPRRRSCARAARSWSPTCWPTRPTTRSATCGPTATRSPRRGRRSRSTIAPDLTKALAWGEAIVALEAAIPPASLRLTMQQKGERTDLQNLIDGRGWRGGPGGNQVANFVDFVTRARPLMQATNGEEISAYLGLAATVNPVDYVGQIQHVRNLHHFEAPALDTLKDNWTNGNTGNLPFTLVLHSGMDHNGAFHHDPNMTAAITNANNFTLMVEGARTLAEISGLLPDLAARYGVGGKIQQAMIAGHGDSRSVEMAGGEGARPGEIRSEGLDLDDNRRQTEAMFNTLLTNMDNGPDARILVNACLTASHEPIERLPAGERAAALAIRNQALREPAIADRLRDMAGAKGFGADTVSAANASFTSDATLIDPATGQLRLGSPGYDPQLTARDRLDYVREGGEPEGALRAVLELWGLADHPAAGGRPALGAVAPSAGGAPAHTMAELKAADAGAGGDRRHALGRPRDRHAVQHHPQRPLERARDQRADAGRGDPQPVRAQVRGPPARVRTLYQVPFAFADDIFTGLSHASEWTTHRLRIVIYHKWAAQDAAHRWTCWRSSRTSPASSSTTSSTSRRSMPGPHRARCSTPPSATTATAPLRPAAAGADGGDPQRQRHARRRAHAAAHGARRRPGLARRGEDPHGAGRRLDGRRTSSTPSASRSPTRAAAVAAEEAGAPRAAATSTSTSTRTTSTTSSSSRCRARARRRPSCSTSASARGWRTPSSTRCRTAAT